MVTVRLDEEKKLEWSENYYFKRIISKNKTFVL